MNDSRTRWMAAALLAVVAAGAVAQAQHGGRLVVVPPVAAVRPGESVRFAAAAAVRADGTRVVPDGMRWTATGGTIDDEGIFTAGAAEGWFAVAAQWGLERAQARVLVRAAAGGAAQVTVEPAVAQMQVGQRAQFQAIALDAQNRVVAAPLVWDATGGGTITQDGIFEATADGAYTVAATSVDGSALGVATVLVGRTPTVGTVRVTLAPPLVTVQAGGTVQLDAFVHDTLNRPAPGRVLWSASGGGTLSPTGQFRATTPGIHLVTAAVEHTGIAGAATVVVSRVPLGPLAGVLVMPRVSSLQLGDSVRLQAMPFDTDGRLVSAPVRWRATGGLVSPRGLFVAMAPGVHAVTAEVVGTRLAGSAQIVVDPEPLARLLRVVLTPPRAHLRIGQSLQFAADAYDEHGHVIPAPLRWACSAGGTVTPTGLFTPRRPGPHTVTAEVAGTPLVDTARVMVGPGGGVAHRVTRLTITPARADLRLGDIQQFVAAAVDQHGRAVQVPIQWQCSGNGTLSQTGHFKANLPGAFRVTALVPGTNLADTAAVTVTAGVHLLVTRLVISPATATLAAGTTEQFTATAYGRKNRPVQVPIEWRCTGGAAISRGGLLSATRPGPCRVTALVPGTRIDATVAVTVTPPVLPVARIDVSPANPTVLLGRPQQFTAIAYDARGRRVLVPLVWHAYGGGSMSPTGLFRPNRGGTWRVSAKAGRHGPEGTTNVLVIDPNAVTVTRITIAPASASLVAGQTQQFTATCHGPRGRVVPAAVVWATTPAGAIDATSGLFQAPRAGTYIVTASVHGQRVTRTAKVTVAAAGPGMPVRVAVLPAQVAVPVGKTVQFRATAYDARGRAIPATVAWQATGGVITGTGRFTARMPGVHRVTATVVRTRIEGHATVTVGQAGGPPPHAAGITVTKWELDRKFLRIEVKAHVTVRGRAAHELKLYAIDRRGRDDRLDTEPAKDGATVRLSGRYTVGAAEHVEVRLLDPAGRVLATERHKAK